MEIDRNNQTIMCGPCKTDTVASARLLENAMGHKAIIYCGYEHLEDSSENVQIKILRKSNFFSQFGCPLFKTGCLFRIIYNGDKLVKSPLRRLNRIY